MKRILLSLLLCAASVRAGDIFIFNSGASTAAMATTLTQAMVYADSLMSESGTVWFAEWIADNGATAVIDSGVSNLIYNTAAASSEGALAAAKAAITASNVVFSAQDLAAAQAAIAASNVVFSAQDLAAAQAAITASNVVFSAQDLAAAQAAIAASNVVFSAQDLAAAQAAIAASNVVFSAQDLAAAQAAIAASNVVFSAQDLAAAQAASAATSALDRAYADGIVDIHASVLASSEASGHIKLGTGLLTDGTTVFPLFGAHQAVPAAASLTWDCARYTSFDITNTLAASFTTVVASNLVAGVPYTLSAKVVGSTGKGLSVEVWPAGTFRFVGTLDSNSIIIPGNKMLLVTLQTNGAGDYFLSMAPVQ
jgi:hypothetical protein